MKEENIQAQEPTETQNTNPYEQFTAEQRPFLKLSDEDRNEGFNITFETDKWRKTAPNTMNGGTDYWFDITYSDGKKYTWTTSAESLLKGLATHHPISGKTLTITLENKDGRKYYTVKDKQ